MRMPTATMLVAPLMVAAAVSAATSAGAAERLTDVGYMAAARCAGLAEAGQGDVKAVNALLDAQRGGRESFVQDKSEEMRLEAQREVRRANAATKQKIAAEVEGACKVYLAGPRLASR